MKQKNDNYIIKFWEPKPALRGRLGIIQISCLQHEYSACLGYNNSLLSYPQTFALVYIPAPVNLQGNDSDRQHRHNTSAVVSCISDYPGITLVMIHQSPTTTHGWAYPLPIPSSLQISHLSVTPQPVLATTGANLDNSPLKRNHTFLLTSWLQLPNASTISPISTSVRLSSKW